MAAALLVLGISGALATASPAGARAKPAVLRATFRSFPDYMDPQLSYTFEGWNAMQDVYVPLLTFRHTGGKAGSEVVPGLARSLPKITGHGRTYTLFLRRGLKYSNGQPVRASDFAYAVKRMFKLHSGGEYFYTGIKGIVSDDATGRVVIRLAKPDGSFNAKLAMMFVAPVPRGTPMHDLSDRPPPATGPYEIVDSKPGRSWSYIRNPAWKRNGPRMPQLPSGHVGRIDVSVMRDDEKQVEAVEQGRFDWMQNPPPAIRQSEIERQFSAQFRLDPTLSTYYFWMNTRKPPFDDLEVRRAVNYAVDPNALRVIYGDQVSPTHQILPPDMPGYRPYHLYPHDMARAKQLIGEADPKDRKITVWTDSEAPNKEAGAYYAHVLRQLGFAAHLKVVSADFYFSVIGNTATPNLDTGWSNWFEDYAHPNDWFEPMLAGSSILPRYNGNFAQIDVPSLNAKISRLAAEPLGASQEQQYAALDRSFMERAPWVPYGTRLLSTFVSSRVDLGKVIWNPTFGADLTSFQFK